MIDDTSACALAALGDSHAQVRITGGFQRYGFDQFRQKDGMSARIVHRTVRVGGSSESVSLVRVKKSNDFRRSKQKQAEASIRKPPYSLKLMCYWICHDRFRRGILHRRLLCLVAW